MRLKPLMKVEMRLRRDRRVIDRWRDCYLYCRTRLSVLFRA